MELSPEELSKDEKIKGILEDMAKIKVEEPSPESKEIIAQIKKLSPEEVAKVLKQILSSEE